MIKVPGTLIGLIFFFQPAAVAIKNCDETGTRKRTMLNTPNITILVTFAFAAVIPIIFLVILNRFLGGKNKK